MKVVWLLNLYAALTLCGAFESIWAEPGVDAASSAPKPDKSQYTLFNPTPTSQMRDFNPDRPSQTDGPLTIDAGHFQIEMGLVTYSRDRTDLTRLDQFDFGQFNLRIGLLNNVEFDVIGTPYSYVRTVDRTTGEKRLQRGFGDLTLRSKINLVGNEGGNFSFGLIPFLNLPTATDNLGAGDVEGGLGLPVQFNLPGGWQMGAETSFNLKRSQDGGVHWEYDNSIELSRSIVEKLGGYVEFFSQISTEAHQGWIGTVDGGFTYQISGNVQIDAGVNAGVTKAATDLRPFVGATLRF
jgi:Putative MetA-pathway of phenol degradation